MCGRLFSEGSKATLPISIAKGRQIYDECSSTPNYKAGPSTQGQAVPGLLTCAETRAH